MGVVSCVFLSYPPPPFRAAAAVCTPYTNCDVRRRRCTLNVQCWCVCADRDPSIHRFVQSWTRFVLCGDSAAGRNGAGSAENPSTTYVHRKLFLRVSICTYAPFLRYFFYFLFSRLSERKGSSSSKEPQFILEDAIHASESSSRGVNDTPAHVFEVRKMDDPVRSPSGGSDRMRVYRSPWSLLAIRTRSLPCFRVTRRISIRR